MTTMDRHGRARAEWALSRRQWEWLGGRVVGGAGIVASRGVATKQATPLPALDVTALDVTGACCVPA
ncbi:MAG TPA: hypothetical protein VGR20_00375 [Acidimicrobiia bacterium]|nr:hypothetical protein [Acidimicrobiia bacterium]